MTRGQLPQLRVERARQGGFELGQVPGRFATRDLRAHARDIGGRHQVAAVAEAGADVRRDPRDPFVGVVHRHHDVAVGLPVQRTRHAPHQDLDDVIAMSLDTRRSGQRRRHHRAGRRALERRAQAVGRVAREADGVEDIAALLQPLRLDRCQCAAAAAATAEGARGCEQPRADQRDAFRGVRCLRRLHHIGQVLQLEEARRQHGLDDDVRIRILRERAVVVRERLVAGLVERLAHAQRLHAHPGVRVLHGVAHQRGVERAKPLERPHRVEPGEQVPASAVGVGGARRSGLRPRGRLRRPGHLPQRGDDRCVLPEDEQPLRHVAPPPVGMREMLDELCG